MQKVNVPSQSGLSGFCFSCTRYDFVSTYSLLQSLFLFVAFQVLTNVKCKIRRTSSYSEIVPGCEARFKAAPLRFLPERERELFDGNF